MDSSSRQRGRPMTTKAVMVSQQIKIWSWGPKGHINHHRQKVLQTVTARVNCHSSHSPWWWEQRQSPVRWKFVPYWHSWSPENASYHTRVYSKVSGLNR